MKNNPNQMIGRAFLLVAWIIAVSALSAQDDAALNINATNQGVLIPRVALTGTDDVTTIPSPTVSLLVYNTAATSDVSPGYYHWDGSKWVAMRAGSGEHYLGEIWGGGIVFLVYDGGQHGLIASLADLGEAEWGFYESNVPNCESMTNGAANTAAIVNAGGTPGQAAGMCDTFSAGGFTDWYLPSLRELHSLAEQDFLIDDILDNDGDPATQGFNQEDGYPYPGAYWSSTEVNDYYAWFGDFQAGTDNSYYKNWEKKVRAIRVF